ncbi:MAG: GntR family transcriptional regulator [Lachnospiraceae bacterium]|jgi:GntR family transcriptional regulator of arabinose operon|nr:GntR family transcriptional regulator [uncultured Acetatifactor sp.]MCI9218605.1 GntR family transcriptional regulator [Lachnospiraceae bacterium]
MGESKYVQVKQSVREQIESGILKPDDKLPTEAEYAEIYNVSGITIRRALTELAEEGYIRRLKHKGTFVSSSGGAAVGSRLIALILYVESHDDSSYIRIIKGAQNMASACDYSLIVEWSNRDTGQEADTMKKMLDMNVEGFLIYPYDPAKSADNYRWLEEKGLPFVLLDHYDIDYPCYFSGCNNYDGAAIGTKMLLEKKHRKIKFVGYNYFLKSEQERFEGFCDIMRRDGVESAEDNLIVNADYDILAGQIERGEITALFCCNDRLAVKVLRELRERGIRIPEDVSVMGFDDWKGMADMADLTTLRQDFDQVGSNAAYLLLSVIQGKLQGNPVKLLSDVSLVMRGTVCENLREA